jgi:RNA polymerase sigma-70 factor, ECF subfamily
MPPYPMWHRGRDMVRAAVAMSWDPGSPHYVGRFRLLPTAANGQPTAAAYLLPPGGSVYRAAAIIVLQVAGDEIVEMTAFHDPAVFAAFALPPTLP